MNDEREGQQLPDAGSDIAPVGGVSRRRFLGFVGGAAAFTAARSVLPLPVFGSAEDESAAGATPLRLRRWAMVADLRKCDGCTGAGLPPQCTQYCIWGHFVPEDMQWVEVYESATAASVSDAPGRFFPAFCMQCQNAPCANACPVGATFQTPEGAVLIDQQRCIGCRLCMAACPYDRRFFNWGKPVQPDYVQQAPYEVECQVPARMGTVMKCDFCTDRAAAGGLPFCVLGCPQGALYYGDLEEDVASNGREVVLLSKFIEENRAVRYKEHLGTQPRVYYIPGNGEDAVGSGSAFKKEDLEWPWPDMVAAAQASSASATALGGGSHG